jgi:hypothetical protein
MPLEILGNFHGMGKKFKWSSLKRKVKLLLLIDELDNKAGKIPVSITKGAEKEGASLAKLMHEEEMNGLNTIR